MIQHRPGNKSPWVARVRRPDGREMSRAFRRKFDAETWETNQISEMRAGDWLDPRLSEISVKKWLERVESGKVVSDSTKDNRRYLRESHIIPTWGAVRLKDVKPEAVQTWIAELSLSLSASTVRHTAAIFSEGMRRAVEYGRLRRDPTRYVVLPKADEVEHRYLTIDEAVKLREQLPEWCQIVVSVGTMAGLRPGENLGLMWKDVSLDDQLLRVTGKVKTKLARRTVSIGTDLTEVLLAHRARFPSVSYVTHRDGRQLDVNNFRGRIWRPAVRESIGQPCVMYDLRHTHVAWLIEAGAHPRAIADRLGHSSIRTTMDTYGGLMESVRADIGGLLDRSHILPAGETRDKNQSQR